MSRPLVKGSIDLAALEWAEEEEPYRLFGLSNWVWLTAAALSAGCWALLTFQGY